MVLLSAAIAFVASHMCCAAVSLDRGREVYQEQLSAIEKQFETDCASCLTYYSNSLARIELKIREAADLHGLVAVRNELERLHGSGTVPEETPDGMLEHITVAQSEYHSLMSRARAKKLRKHVALIRSYSKSLEALKVRLVKQGDIDEAVNVADELKAVEFMLADVEVELAACDTGVQSLPASREPARKRSGRKAELYISCDNKYVIWLNGTKIGSSTNWRELGCYPIEIAENDILAIKAEDLETGNHMAGLYCGIVIDGDNGSWGTGPDWHCSVKKPPANWRTSREVEFEQGMSTENIHTAHDGRERSFLAVNQHLVGDIIWSRSPSRVIYVREVISFSRFTGTKK
jgi:hypothetical protein